MSHASRDRLLLAAAWLAVVVSAVLTHPLLPVDETRYASVAWEMWQRGEFLVPVLNGEAYSHKPPLFFWLVHAGWWLTGVNEWVLRLVPALLALLVAWLCRRLARQLWPDDTRAADVVPAVLLACLVFIGFSPWVQMDLLLVACTVLAMNGLLEAARGRRSGWLLGGIGIGLGVLSKGPVILVQVLPVALLAPLWLRSPQAPRWGRWYAGVLVSVLIGALLALAWALPAASAGGEAYREAIFWGQSADRLVESFAHAHPAWWYLPWLPLLFAPWSLLPWVWRALAQARPAADAGMRFCLAWMVAVFILMSLISGKQLKYLLPLLPAFALLLARVLGRMPSAPVGQKPWLPAGLLLLLGVLGMVLPAYLESAAWVREVRPLWGGLLLLAGLALVLLPRLRPLQYPPLLAVLSAGLITIAHLGLFAAAAPAYDLRAASEFVASAQAEGRQVASAKRYHGQFGFYGRLRQPVVQLEPEKVLQWARQHPRDYVMITGKNIGKFAAAAVFAQPYRSGYLAIIDGATLGAHPEYLH